VHEESKESKESKGVGGVRGAIGYHAGVRKIIALVVLISLVVVPLFWYRSALAPVEPGSPVRVSVQIPKGAMVSDIARLLKEEDIIRSSLVFTLYVRFHGLDRLLQAGSFILRPSMSVTDLVSVLTRGFADELIITIPEGFTVQDIDALLAEKGITETGAVVACARTCDFSSFEFLPKTLKGPVLRSPEPVEGRLEGYLFPDTYFVTVEEFQPKLFLERMLSTFRRRVVQPFAKEIAESGRSLHELITMASLIEEETRTNEERPIVSGILWKRLKAGMGLDVDATIRYILGKPQGVLTEEDLRVNSPYNTRKFRGLPPGPIANPSLSSIRAALRPQDSPYWYYLHDSQGNIRYAKTNDEHNVNKAKYLR